MAYSPIGWKNNSLPAINAENLNHMDEQISQNTDDVEEIKTDVEEIKTDVEEIKTDVEEIKTDVDKKIDKNTVALNFANALKGVASGHVIGVNDVSTVKHNTKLNVTSLNMLDIAKAFINPPNIANLNTNNNTISFEKTQPSSGTIEVGIPVYLEKGKYTISFIANSNNTNNIMWAIANHDNSLQFIKDREFLDGEKPIQFEESFEINQKGLFDILFIMGYGASVGTSVSFENPQLEKGETKTDYKPFVDIAAVTGYKGNIANIPDIAFTTYAKDMTSHLQWYIDLPLGTNFTISANGNLKNESGTVVNWTTKLNDSSTIRLFNGLVTDGARKSVKGTKTKHFELSEVAFSYLYCGSSSDPSGTYYKNFTINIGDEDLGYDTYDPQTYIPDDYGNIEVTSSSPNMSFVQSYDNVMLKFEYNRDINKAFDELTQAIISLGGTV